MFGIKIQLIDYREAENRDGHKVIRESGITFEDLTETNEFYISLLEQILELEELYK